jgi:hypothetical protein
MSARLQLVQLVHLADAGMVRVAWSPTWSSHLVTVTRAGHGVVAEHVVADRARALAVADQAVADLADLAGMPA